MSGGRVARYPSGPRMSVRLTRRVLLAALAVTCALVAAGLGFGPLVRSRVGAEAVRRRLDVSVEGVRPAWFGVRLRGLVVRPRGVQGFELRIDEVRVGVGLGLHVDSVRIRGAAVVLTGSEASLREAWATWRADEGPQPEVRRAVTPVSLDGLSLVWRDGDLPLPRLELRGVELERDRDGVRAKVGDARARFGPATLAVYASSGALDASGALTRARAASVLVEWTAGPGPSPRDGDADDDDPRPSASATRRSGQRGALPVVALDAAAPLLPLPDLHAARAAVSGVAKVLAERIPTGADVGVDALTWKFARAREGVALSIGPGPLSIARSKPGLDVEFSTGPGAANTALSVRVILPTETGDATLVLEGGPVSLGLLGIEEGAAGLVDVAHATIAGRARAVLAGDGTALTFEGDWAARGLSLESQRLASDVVRDLDLQFRARGALTAPGELRLDDLTATLGAIHLGASGVLDQQPDHVVAAFRFDVPMAGCQSLLDSVPTALLPGLQGTSIAGMFAARGRFAFDSRALDDLELGYQIEDRCRVVEVPPPLARERYRQPFTHKIYLPDGSIGTRTTGPGTPTWTALDQISPYMQVAVLTTEDGAFPHHHGFNHASIRASIIANLKARRFVRGASTITMQLAKNLFLSREKTLARKLEEVVLTDYLEQAFSKDELMELYLNIIEFGPAVYGIAAAADHYFGRTPAELSLAESLFLSSVLPAPKRYGAMRNAGEPSDGAMRTLHTLMQIARRVGLISDEELAEAKSEAVAFWHGGDRPTPRPPVHARPGRGADVEDTGGAPAPDETESP
jgi:hypothetical protein